jgi:ABC-type polysaccharide/polyol phosphate transport system ATPase subunit
MPRVVLENVSVEFPIYGAQEFSLRHALKQRAIGGMIHRDSARKDRVVVRGLTDINLQLHDGDRLGLVGHNGSGKSTLLKVLAGIYEPVQGRITVNGRVTPLFDMMPGLDPEDTGYENVITSGLLLGMSREQVLEKLPEIEEVSELGDYLSLPVRTYSAGMSMRLGFALVTALDPDVLIMDEGFGAADLRFTSRTAERIDDFIGRSRVMVLASHSDAMIQSICNKAALMKEGQILKVGPCEEIFDEYHFMVYGKRLHEIEVIEEAPPEEPPPVYSAESIAEVGLKDRQARTNGAACLTRFSAHDRGGEVCWTYSPDDTITFNGEFKINQDITGLSVILRILSFQNGVEQIVSDVIDVLSEKSIKTGTTGSFTFILKDIKLRPGIFNIYVSLVDRLNTVAFDVIDQNVGLPALTINNLENGKKGYLAGVVSMQFERKVAKIVAPG